MPLREDQLNRLAQAETSNALKGRYLADHMTVGSGNVVAQSKDKTWLDYLADMSADMSDNARVMLNVGTRTQPQTSKSVLILSSEGFPADIKVNYTFLNPGTYVPWTSNTAREIKQVVLHSFGQQWHAFEVSGGWAGYMNTKGSTPLEYAENDVSTKAKIVWVPRGTDAYLGMYQAERIATTLRSLLTAAEGVTGVHFLIDRAGNLYVLCDCNHILRSSGALSDTCVSIALEESLYADSTSDGGHPLPYTWQPDGSGNLIEFDYSPFQYNTLAALLAKLRLAYPALRTSNYSTSPFSIGSEFIGYTMHGHIKDAAPEQIDVAPHLADSGHWDKLFAQVDAQDQMSKVPVWQKFDPGYKSRMSWVLDITTSMGVDAIGFAKQATTNPAVPILAGAYRSQMEASKSAGYYRDKGARYSVNESQLQSLRQSVGVELESIAGAPLVLPDVSVDPTASIVTVDDLRHSGVSSEGLF